MLLYFNHRQNVRIYYMSVGDICIAHVLFYTFIGKWDRVILQNSGSKANLRTGRDRGLGRLRLGTDENVL